MLKVIQQKLKESLILDENEPVLSLIQVVDYYKQQQQNKKVREEIAALLPASKKYILLASIKRAENDSTPIIYLLKMHEKTNDLKLKLTWNLNEIKQITQPEKTDPSKQTQQQQQHTGNNDSLIFEMLLKNENSEQRKLVWLCEKQGDREDFLNTLWKLSEEFLKSSDRPKFINFQFENKMSNSASESTSQSSSAASKTTTSSQYEISKSEEDSLLKLMAECDFASSNAEKFMEKLQAELIYLDTSNIESIMNSEENTLKLIEMLDAAVDEIDKIDKRLKDYEEKISAVGDAVRIVGERDNVIQLQQNNQHSLRELLEELIDKIEFPKQSLTLLNDCDLQSPKKIEMCAAAANQLLEILDTDLPAGLKKMKAFEEQITALERLKLKFCNSVHYHIKNAIGLCTNQHFESFKVVENSLNVLPSHQKIHEHLLDFKELMPWMYKSNCYFNDNDQRKTYFNDIKQNYIETLRQIYLYEITPFCLCAKAKIGKNEKTKSTASMENLKGSLIRSLDKSHAGDQFVIRIDPNYKETLKLVFTKLMNQLTVTVQSEQTFCQEFFNIRTPAAPRMDTSTTSQSLQSSTAASSVNREISRSSSNASMLSGNSNNNARLANTVETKNDLQILSEIFTNTIEDQVKIIIESIIKTENMMVIFIYSDLLHRVVISHNNKHFMHQPLISLLRSAKEKCDEYIVLNDWLGSLS